MDIEKLPKLVFWVSCALLVFAYGVAVGQYRIFPYAELKFAQDAVEQVFAEREMITGIRPTEHLGRVRYPGEGVTRLEPDATPGLTFLSGFFEDRPEVRLVRLDGSVVNQWYIPFREAFPDASHIAPEADIPLTEWNFQIHGALVLPDGSAVYNMSYKGMVKLDRCSNLEWSLPLMAHHSLERSGDGGFWSSGRHYSESGTAFLPATAPYLEDTLLKISSDGEVLSELSVPALFFEDEVLRSLYLSTGLDIVGLVNTWGSSTELVHVNDVEELRDDLADRFPLFEAGDLLVSLRNLNLLMVVDPETQEVKWRQTGPWIRQHDPDFTHRGTITVFNNNADMTRTGTIFGGSNIIEIDPTTRETRVLYGVEAEQVMYTEGRGKHQVLGSEGDHLLITETDAGRVLEVNGDGEIVWELINRYDESAVATVTQATRYPEDYFQVEDWACP